MRPLALFLLLSVSSIAPLSAANAENPSEPAATPVVQTSSNAAPLYRQAMAAMRPFTEEEDALLNATTGRDALDTPASIPVEQAQALLSDFAPALAAYKEATQQPQCDWALDYTAGPELKFDHFSALIPLTKLTLLQARLHLQSGDYPAALENIRQALTTRQQAAPKAPLFIEALVQRALEALTTYTLASDLSLWPAESLKSLAALLDRTPALPDFAQSIQAERKYLIGWFKERADLALKNGTPLPEEFLAGLPAQRTPEEIVAGIQQLDEDYATFASFLQHPFPESLTRIDTYLEEMTASENARLLSAESPRALVTVYSRTLGSSLRFAMLRTAIDIRLNGPDAVKSSRDPLTHQPFTYKSLEDGKTFQLSFEPQIHQESITLTIR